MLHQLHRLANTLGQPLDARPVVPTALTVFPDMETDVIDENVEHLAVDSSRLDLPSFRWYDDQLVEIIDVV